jgi:hypothetical protein
MCLYSDRFLYGRDFFFLISTIISLKSVEGRNPSTQEVYKSDPNQRRQKNMNVRTQQT